MAIQEAVRLHRQLMADRPAAFKPDLAHSLSDLSLCLSDLCHQEDALMAIQEAVKLYQHLAAERPAVFNSKLAKSLRILSKCQSALGHQEDA